MSYATQDDLTTRTSAAELVQLTDLSDPPAGVADADKIQGALDDADAEINSYLGKVMDVPLTDVPRIIVNRACAIARFRLWADHASDRVRQDYEDAIAWLQNVAKGVIALGDNTQPAEQTTAGSPQVSSPGRTFSRDTLKDFC